MNRVMPSRARLPRFRCWQGLPWPLPALLCWSGTWALYLLLRGLDGRAALAAGVGAGLGLAWLASARPARRLLIAAGFPASLLAGGLAAELPAALWLLPLALLALVYPLSAWRDAPVYPTPAGALQGLAQATGLPPHARLLDAGCGLGHGLRALRSACAGARLEGVERSPLLRRIAQWRCPDATLRRGDMWRMTWQPFDLVYLYQRPESMAGAWAKAEREMAAGAWLASLEFAVPGRAPDAVLRNVAGKPVWLYRIGRGGGAPQAQYGTVAADNSAGRRAERNARPSHIE